MLHLDVCKDDGMHSLKAYERFLRHCYLFSTLNTSYFPSPWFLYPSFLFSGICSHQYFFLLPFSICYMKSSKVVTLPFSTCWCPQALSQIQRFPSEIQIDISIIQMSSQKTDRAASVSLILWSTSETENVSQWSSESLPLLYLKSLSSPLLFISLTYNWTTKLLKPKAKYCPQSLSWYLTPNFQVRELFLELTYTLLWYFYGYHCCITTLKVRGIKQSFYYARLFCGSGIWTEDDEDGISLSDATCELSCGWLHGWKLTSESIFTHTVVTIFGKHNHAKDVMLLWIF